MSRPARSIRDLHGMRPPLGGAVMNDHAETAIVPQQQTTPMHLIQVAVEQGADVEKLSRLMDLQMRWEANEARKAFVAAMNAFKADPPRLEKIKPVDFSSKNGGHVKYNYAPLDYIAKEIGDALSKHDLSFRWEVQQTPSVKVTCILQHSGGHSECVSLEAPLHDDQRMNP